MDNPPNDIIIEEATTLIILFVFNIDNDDIDVVISRILCTMIDI